MFAYKHYYKRSKNRNVPGPTIRSLSKNLFRYLSKPFPINPFVDITISTMIVESQFHKPAPCGLNQYTSFERCSCLFPMAVTS